ncbi:MAG: trimethylamine methyltransferase family protein, partial [Rhodobacteraceae bacterium]|nr:trimethylamine methyltransferase family protein [Paracoccaceae bacterium]
SYEKFVMDADRLGVLHGFAGGVEARLDDALDALREVGPGGHFLGREPEMAGGWQSDIFDNRTFEAWIEDGGRDAMKLATERVRDLLESYEPPALDPAIDEALSAFVAAKKAEMPDSFM